MADKSNFLVGIISIGVFFVSGIIFAFFPERIRDQALGKSKKSHFGGIMHSQFYLNMVRAGGVLAFVASGLIAGVIFFH